MRELAEDAMQENQFRPIRIDSAGEKFLKLATAILVASAVPLAAVFVLWVLIRAIHWMWYSPTF